MGALGGGCWHMYRGLKNSPKGYKIVGAIDVSVNPSDPLLSKPVQEQLQQVRHRTHQVSMTLSCGAICSGSCCRPSGERHQGWAATLPIGV